MPFCGMFQFAIPILKSVFGRIGQGQQPFRGVGRLRLSFLGNAEPRLDKCNDLRLFRFYKIDENLCGTGADSNGATYGGFFEYDS